MTHVWGYQNYETGDNSRNNILVGLWSNGEGWHNNHHADQRAAAHGHKWWEFDVTWITIRVLEKLGLVKNVVRPRAWTKDERMKRGASACHGPGCAEGRECHSRLYASASLLPPELFDVGRQLATAPRRRPRPSRSCRQSCHGTHLDAARGADHPRAALACTALALLEVCVGAG